MSYDLMVFDSRSAPRERQAFTAWYRKQTEWSEGHDYQDAARTTPELRNWYEAMRREFPNMNGLGAPTDDDLMKPGVEDRLADYSIGASMIYVAFPWSSAEAAYELTRRRAVDFGVGFYDVSGDEGDGEIHFPGSALRPPSGGAWRAVAKEFRELKDQE